MLEPKGEGGVGEKGVDVVRRKQHQSYINRESEAMEG